MNMIIGLDVHSKKTVYVAQELNGDMVGEGSVSTTVEGLATMIEALKAPKGTRIGLETGTQATWVSRLLGSMDMEPVVIDAREVRVKARRIGQKSDRRDAFEICDGLRRDIYTAIVFVPDRETQKLRQIISRRRHFVKLCTSQVNAAKFLLRAVGLQQHAASLNTEIAWRKLLKNPAVASVRKHMSMHSQVWQVAHRQANRLEKELEKALSPFGETTSKLMTIPGVGKITAATFIAVLGTPARFQSSGHAASYIGLVPSTYDSGERERHGAITKRGSGELRALLCEAAQHASRPTHPLSPYFRRIAAKGGYRKAVVAIAHRLARILFQMWKKGEIFDVMKLNVTREPKTISKMVYYRLRAEGRTA